MGAICPFFFCMLVAAPIRCLYKLEGRIQMIHRFRLQYIIRRLCNPHLLFAAVWILGLFLGAVLAPTADDPLFSLMRPEIHYRVSIVTGLITAFLPLLIAAYGVYSRKSRLLYLICFFRAFHFSFCGSFICTLYGNAGWLVRIFLQFTDLLSVPVLCWFCIRQIPGDKALKKKDLVISLALTAAAFILDHFLIAPFFANLTDNILEGSLIHVGFDLRL